MPKVPIDYKNTIIYKIVHKDDYENTNIYIGSTTDFIRRKNNHKDCSQNLNKKSYNDKKYQYIRENGGWGDFNMVEVEKFPCNDGNEARAREEYWRSYFNAQLNSKKSFTTDQERLDQMKCYYTAHKERMNDQMKQRYLRVKASLNSRITEEQVLCV